MTSAGSDNVFAGSVPSIYDSYLVPLIFEPYAADLVHRLPAKPPGRVLEVAAGTGVVTRALDSVLPETASVVATDLNQAMLDRAAARGTKRPVEWRQADAMQLPFENGTFDLVVCQFGFMFFADKAKAFAQAHRVLRPGGVLLFNVWDRLETNEIADTVTTALATVFTDDPPRFMARTPYGYHERAKVESDLLAGGFTAPPEVVTLAAPSRAKSPRDAAVAFCHGTPLRGEIETRDAKRLGEATDVVTEAIGRRFGRGEVDAQMQAHVVTVGKW